MNQNPSDPLWSIIPPQINSVSISDDGSRCAYGTSYERGTGDFYTFLYDETGTLIWKKPVVEGQKTYQGVFWVSVSGNGQYVASGGETVDTNASNTDPLPGFLQAYEATTGTQLLNITLNARINQVSLSKDGLYLAVCYGKTIEVYMLTKGIKNPGEFIYYYKSIFKTTTSYDINSCVISRDGSTVVASGILYTSLTQKEEIITGHVFSYSIDNTTVSSLGGVDLAAGCMRVAVTDTGQYWAASSHDGSCMLFNRASPNEMEWQCTPTVPGLELAYAVDITETEGGEVYVACGANLSGTGDGGYLYLVKSTPPVNTENSTNLSDSSTNSTGVVQWSNQIQYGVNPGVSLDKNATYVTATDGKPDGQTINESAGSFYLFQAATGDLIWQKNTSMMNWPMMLSRDGSSVIGGSDDGSFYFWQAPYS